jgi:hydroxyacylglutathione hydrolase
MDDTHVRVLPFERGPVETIGYLVADVRSGKAIVIDVPFQSSGDLLAALAERKWDLTTIVITHGHWDHTGDAASLAAATGAPVGIHHLDEAMLVSPDSYGFTLPHPLRGIAPDRLLEHGDILVCGSLRFEILHVPGHTRGHIALFERSEGLLFTGDVLFHGSIGRTDLPGGSYDMLLDSIVTKLLPLPGETVVFPGHGSDTTISRERKNNPYILDYLDHFE